MKQEAGTLDCYDFYLLTTGTVFYPESSIPEWIPIQTNERTLNE